MAPTYADSLNTCPQLPYAAVRSGHTTWHCHSFSYQGLNGIQNNDLLDILDLSILSEALDSDHVLRERCVLFLLDFITEFWYPAGRAEDQAVRRLPFIADARVCFQDNLCWICGGQSDTGTRLFPVLRFFAVSFVPPLRYTTVLSHPPTLYNLSNWHHRQTTH